VQCGTKFRNCCLPFLVGSCITEFYKRVFDTEVVNLNENDNETHSALLFILFAVLGKLIEFLKLIRIPVWTN
jgi:hypothetical protein